MYKSIVKISTVIFLILCIVKVNSLYIRDEEPNKNIYKRISEDAVVGNFTNNNLIGSNINGSDDIVVNDNKPDETTTSTLGSVTITSVTSTSVTPTTTGNEADNSLTLTTTAGSTPTSDRGHNYSTKFHTDKKTTSITKVKTTTENIVPVATGMSYQNNDPDKNNINKGPITEPDGGPDGGSTNSNKESENKVDDKNPLSALPFLLVAGVVSIGLVAVSSYRVLKRRSEARIIKASDYFSSTGKSTEELPSTFSSEQAYSRNSLVASILMENEGQNVEPYMYYIAKNNPYSNEVADQNNEYNNDLLRPNNNNLPYQASGQADGNESENSKSFISVNRNSKGSIKRHSFLNPDIKIIRTGKRTQQLFEASDKHPAIIETFPSLERPFVPAVPVPIEESDENSLHPHQIYQMYQENNNEMEFENYYAYTIDDKEYIIDPMTNRVLEIHDLNTDEYMLVEEELYLDFSSSSSEDSDEEKQL